MNVVGVACVLGLAGNLAPLPRSALHQETQTDGFRGRALLSTSEIQVRRVNVVNNK